MTEKFGTNVYAPVVAGSDTADDMAVAYGDELGRTIHHFENESDKNAFTLSFKSRLFHSWCVVRDSSAWYEWTGTKEDGSDGDWNEIDLGSSAGGLVIDGHSVSYFDLGPNLQLDNPDASPRLLVNPRSFENQHAASCLLQLDSDVTVQSGHATKLYTSHEVIPTGEYFSLNQIAHGVNVQDNTGGDTAVTGGELTRIMASVGFYGDKATDDCNVKIWVWYKDPASPLAGGILSDVNGKPMIVERSYNAGDVIREPLIITGAMMATGNAPIVLYIEASGGSWVINPDQTLICIEQFTDGFETSLASIEFERRIGVEINAEIKQFKTKMLSMKEELLGVDEPEATISAHTGYDYLNEFGVQNLTAIKASIAGGVLQIKDNGVPADTYVDVYLDNAKTTMLRGKVIDYDVTMANPQDAWRLEVYKWTGKADRAGRVYDSRNNGALNLNDDFELVKSKFISENPSGSFKGYLDTATVPDDAVNLFIILRPVDEQDPIDLSMKDFTWGVANPFRGYTEVSQHNLHENHLKFSENWAEFYLNNQGYPSIRYTINNTPSSGNPMPVGVLGKGRAPVEIDNTVNQVSGSADPQNDGAIKFLKDGEASISKSYNLRNEQNTENTVTFWDVLIDIDGTESKIPDSELTVRVPANTGKPGVIYSIPAYVVEVETGQRVGGRAISNKADGAYVQSDNITEYIVQTDIDFKELVADGSDDPWGDIDLTQFEDVYTNSLTVTKVFHSAASAMISDLPTGALVFAKAAFKHIADGSIRPVAKLDQSYKGGVLTVSFGETADVMIILEINL